MPCICSIYQLPTILFQNFGDIDDNEKHEYYDWSNELGLSCEENAWQAYNARNKAFFQPECLETFVNTELFSEPIKNQVDLTRGELFLMILKFSLVNSLNLTGMSNLYKLVNTMFKTLVLPESRYIIDKLLNPKDGTEFHAVCPQCNSYLGKFGPIEITNLCQNCKSTVNLNYPSNNCFFALIDPSKQISDLINAHQDHYKYVTESRR